MNNSRNLRLLFGLSLMFLLVISQTSHVAAANNQGLEWGVSITDRFDYDVKATYQNSTFNIDVDDAMYVIIDDLPAIADDITSLAQLTFLDFTSYWDNGTEMTSFWQDIMSVIPFYLYPIGNWSLIETLSEDPQVELTQDATVFMSVRTPSETYNSTIIIMKSDGAFAYLKMEWVRSGMGDELTIELTRDGYTPPASTTTSDTATTSTTPTGGNTGTGDSTLLLIVGGGAAAVVLIIVVVIFAKRRG